MTSYYSNHRDHLLVVIEKERHEIDRTDAKMNEAHRAHCRIIHRRLAAELDDYDEAIRVAAAAARAKKPAEVADTGPAEVEL